jgi:hypothetical protein
MIRRNNGEIQGSLNASKGEWAVGDNRSLGR